MALTTASYSDNSGTAWGDGTSSTVTGVDIGTAAASRVVVLYVVPTNGTLTALTIGGIAATQDSTGNLWKAAVSTGTTATVVGTGDQILVRARWAVTGDAAASWGTGVSGGGGGGGSGSSVSVSVSAGGTVIALGGDNSGATCTFTSGVSLDGHPSSADFGGSLFLAAGHTDYASSQSVTVGISASAANAVINASPLNPSGGGGTSVNADPTGNAGTGSAGTPTVSGKANVTQTGVSATGAAGTPTVSGKANVTPAKVTGTGAAGTPTVSGKARVTLSGVSATGTAGTATATVTATANITGNAGTGAAGTPTVTGLANVSLTGVAGTGAANAPTVTGIANVDLTGVEGTGAVGTVTTSTAGNIDVAVSGVEASATAGTPTAVGAANVIILGVFGSVEAGSVTVPTTTEQALYFGVGGYYERPRSKRLKDEIERAEQLLEDAPKVVTKAVERAKAAPETDKSAALLSSISDALIRVNQEALSHASQIAGEIAADVSALERKQAEQERQRAIRAAKALLAEIEAMERDEEDAIALLLAS